MTTTANPFTDRADRSQEATTTAVQTWLDTVQSLTGATGADRTPLPDLRGMLEQYFDYAEKALRTQRALAHQWLSGTIQASEAVSDQARRAATRSTAEHTATATEAVVDNATETAPVTARAATDAQD